MNTEEKTRTKFKRARRTKIMAIPLSEKELSQLHNFALNKGFDSTSQYVRSQIREALM